jgi:type VI secretion system protein ImpF
MPSQNLPTTLLPSLKDRLFDADSTGTAAQPGYTLAQILESVREDLEELLNTRRSQQVSETHYSEVARSIVTFGLPDLSNFGSATPVEQQEIGRIIEKIITQNEPRLSNVRATPVKTRALAMRLRFHIDAQLCVTPAPLVAFETEVELTTGHASIRERT